MNITITVENLFNELFSISQSIAKIYQKMISEPNNFENLFSCLKSAVSIENKLIEQCKQELDEYEIASYLNEKIDQCSNFEGFNHLCRLNRKFLHLLNQKSFPTATDDVNIKIIKVNRKELILENLKLKNMIAIEKMYQDANFYQADFQREILLTTYLNPWIEESFLKTGQISSNLANDSDIHYLSFLYRLTIPEVKAHIEMNVESIFKTEFANKYKDNSDRDFYIKECQAIDMESLLLLLSDEEIEKVYQSVMRLCMTQPIELQIKNRRFLEIFDNIKVYKEHSKKK